ncbi:MAG: N-acetyltransferase [Wujia sp.]|nr:N-acetyltransferase [Wujia sp.]MDY3727518.1 N-acetyltransferase [Wujia sp.]
MKNHIVIRLEEKSEYREVENLVRDSFWNVYRPGCLEHYVLNQLRNDPAFVPELDYSLEKAAELGCGALCFEGNIDFYGKSGFRQASEYGIRYHGLPEGEDASFFLCKELIPGYLDGITGEYATLEGYLVDAQEAEAFDKQFPYKEKKKLPGQIF